MKKLPILLAAFALFFTKTAVSIELPGASALADLILDSFDGNADGILDAGEWQSGVSEGFEMIDADFNGKIDAAELERLASPIGDQTGELAAKLITPLISKIVLSFDTDDNGSVEEAEYSEKTNALWKKADADEDAVVTAEELRGMPGALLVQ